jgi:hypothetical protein
MALKAIVEALDDVPEALHEYYKEQNEVFVLGIDGIDDHPSVKNLKSAHERQKKETAKYKDKAGELETALDAFGEITVEEVNDLRTKAEEGGTKAPTAEELNELVEKRFSITRAKLEKAVETANEELAQYKSENERLSGSLQTERIDNKFKDAFVAAGVRKKALPMASRMVHDTWRLDDEGTPIAMNGEEPMNGAHGPLTPEEWVEGLRAEHDYLFEPNTGGNAAGSGGNSKPAGVAVLSDITSADDIDAIAKGEAVRAE